MPTIPHRGSCRLVRELIPGGRASRSRVRVPGGLFGDVMCLCVHELGPEGHDVVDGG
jgi:hypothetical protein